MKTECLPWPRTKSSSSRRKKQCAEKQADGIACRMVDSKELHEAEPNLAPDIYGAIEFTEGGSLNPMLFGFALGEKVEKLGGELMRFTRVLGIELNSDGSVGKVLTDKGDILTKYVIDAAGVWSPEIGKMVGVDIPVTKMKGDILVAESDVQSIQPLCMRDWLQLPEK